MLSCCHGQDSKKRMANCVWINSKGQRQIVEGGPLWAGQSLNQCALYQRITGGKQATRMPPVFFEPQLDARSKSLS